MAARHESSGETTGQSATAELRARVERLEADLAFVVGFVLLKDKGHAQVSEHGRAAEIAKPYMDHRFDFPEADNG